MEIPIEISLDEGGLEFTVDKAGGWPPTFGVCGPIGNPEIYIVTERERPVDYGNTKEVAMGLAYERALGHARDKSRRFNRPIVDKTPYNND